MASSKNANPSTATTPKPTQQQPVIPGIACRSITVKSSPTAMRMSPPATLRNWKFHKHLIAVGSTNGTIQIFNLELGKLHRELSVHSLPVLGIEWVALNAFISYSVSDSPQSNELNWELNITELDTGRTVQLKCGRGSESSYIQSVKVSHLHQYFIVIYKNQPFEIWDLANLSLVRRVPKKFSGIVAAEWSPLYSKNLEPIPNSDKKSAESMSQQVPTTRLRENFVVTTKAGELFHFSIAGNVVKEISNIPPESAMNKAATAIAWKSDHVVLGQNDGSISVWDLERKESRTMCTMRGSIKKMRFAPGRDNLKILLLFDDGADVWDVRRLRLFSTVSTKIKDADWAASDRPVILDPNGQLLVTDIEFKHFYAKSSSLSQAAPSSVGVNNEPCHLQ